MVAKYHHVRREGEQALLHVVAAEKVFGRRLPPGTIVHHADGNSKNNVNENLVICPSQEYHLLLHIRMRALAACGNPNFRKCAICKQWDDVKNMKQRRSSKAAVSASTCHHLECDAQRAREYRRAKHAY